MAMFGRNVPNIVSSHAPEKTSLASRRWIVVYEGTVAPAETGRYTFVGNADDVIAVRFNNRMVLGGSASKKSYVYSSAADKKFMIAQVGETLSVNAGTSYPITIAIGEIPGGAFGAYLLLQKEGVESRKDGTGNPILPVFKFAPGPTSTEGKNLPPIAPDASWSVWKSVPAAPKGGSSLLPR